ncbi:hypothetical protein ETS23_06365 [Vibrio parahaemolyticus]|nr:hypothetical protein [Vibrio parahaemolyticus]
MNVSNQGITFSSSEEAAQFRRNHAIALDLVIQRVKTMQGVNYADVWLNQNSPSFVAGYDSNDEQIVRIKLIV